MIVNTSHIRAAEPFDQGDQMLILRNGKRLTTGRSYRKVVQDFLRGRLANFKVPKDIQFLDAMPREATGKIFKRKLRDLHAAGTLRAMA